VAEVPVEMAAGIASGMVHLITVDEEPRQLIAAGPTVTRALELAAVARAGETRAETIDRSAIETPGTSMAWPSSTFIASEIQDLIVTSATVPEPRSVTVGYAIFSGVDRALQRNPARAGEHLTTVVAEVVRAAAEFDVAVLGTDVSHDGGRIALVTGLSGPADDGEERMIRAAKAALEDVTPFALRFGIATGDVLAGAFGGADRRSVLLVGETAALAARLAASAAPGEVLTTHRAIDRATTRYAISEWEPVTYVGIDFQVVPVVVGPQLADGEVEGGFVGRSAEQATITRLLGELAHGRGSVVDVVGGAGIGKSRLVTEALRDADVPVVVIRGEEDRQNLPYGAASRLLRGALGIDEEDDPVHAGALLTAQVRELTPYLQPLLPLVADVIGAEVDPTDAVAEISDDFRRERTQWAVSQLAVWLTKEPMVFVIEDAQWIDGSSADLLSYVLARGADLPWLVVATRRPTKTGWIPGEEIDPVRIELQPLAPGAARALLTELRREDPLTKKLAAEIIERSGGIPYLLERLTAMAGKEKKLPGNVEGAAAAEIARLDPADRKALGDLSVLGLRFDTALAAEVVGIDRFDVLGDLLQIENDGRCAFRQAVVREAAYSGLSAQRRRDLHLRTAEALAERGAPPGVLAWHVGAAGADQAAWAHGVAAGTAAMERKAPAEGAALLDLALGAARRLGSISVARRAGASELLGDAYAEAGRFKDADKAYVAAEGMVKLRRDQARLAHKRAALREREGQYPAALRMLTKTLKTIPKSSGHKERAELELLYARIRLHQGHCREAIERADEAIPLAKKAREPTALGRAHYLKAKASSYLEPGTGAADARTALDLFEKVDDHFMQARVLDLLGAEALEQGRWDEALEIEERSAAEHEVAGDAIGSALAGYHRARVMLDQGKLDEAEAELRHITAASRAANHPLGVAISTMHLARGLARRGDSEKALGMLGETLGQLEQLDADRHVVGNLLAQAEAHLLGGEVEEALAVAAEAKGAAKGVAGVEITMIGLQRVRGMALVWMGRTKEGHVQLIEALNGARLADAAFEEALILDALATLFGDGEAADRRDEIVASLGVVKLPPFLTVG
jgi:class 3 adenylate cyclase/tetratricopeptide (TPR) repeat protein